MDGPGKAFSELLKRVLRHEFPRLSVWNVFMYYFIDEREGSYEMIPYHVGVTEHNEGPWETGRDVIRIPIFTSIFRKCHLSLQVVR